MDNFKSNYLKRTLSLVLAVIMIITLVPLGNFTALAEPTKPVDALSSATYYRKANWENKIKDKSRWKVEDDQTLVRVGGGDPVQMNDIDYDGMFIDANGRYVIRLVYKEKSQAVSGVWYRALINFGDLDKFIDFDLSYVLGKDGKTQYKFDPVSQFKGRGFDLGKAAGDRTNNRANLPINLVLKEGVDLDKLGTENYIVQMRVANGDYTRIYAYAPKGTSMDYSTYTKTTAVDLADKLGTLFIKGGKQSDLNNATNQEFFMSEFIANPDQYPDKSNLGIIRTQYMGQTNTLVRETVGGQPIAYTQVFDANLVKYMKADSKENVAYVNVMTNGRVLSPVTKNVGIPLNKINYSEDGKLAYFVIGTKAFQKDGVKVVNVDKLDQHVMLSGFYITAIDYVVDKGEFENTFSNDKVRKLNYAMMSGWTNPNKNGWVIYEKDYANEYVVPEGESYLIDTTETPTGGQIMIQVGGDQAILRKPQGYYNGYVSGNGANDYIEEYAKGVYKFTLREGATILPGKKLRVYMPYTASHDKPVNFLEINNATKRNQGAATLTLNNDRNITMHIYKEGKKGHFVLRYTLADGTESSMEFTPKVLWKYSDKDRILTGVPNTSADGAGGNFYINTKKLKAGADIFVESYDGSGNKIDSETSWFKYVPLTKAKDNVKELTWTDHSDKKAVLSINKSLYTPYQLLFTNDYAEGSAYQDPRKLPADDASFNTATTSFVGYTKYDGGKVRTLYEEGKTGKYIAKVEADENDYDDKGNIKGQDVRKKITIPKTNIFDPHFDGESKQYNVYEYTVDLSKMKAYQSEDKTDKSLTLLKDMKFVSTASDGSSLPSDLLETRVRARVLFDTTEGKFADNTKKTVKIVPDNVKFYGEEGYVANGFEGANVEANTGDKFPEAPKFEGKNFLGWVTEAGKTALGNNAVATADAFAKLSKDQIFTNETPVTKHLVVYAIYSEDVAVTFDANQGKFADDKDTTTVKAEGGNVTKPTEPTREGYIFKGWAATKDAKQEDPDILNGVTAPKTVYAVWEKKAEEALTLKNPEKPVEVKDPTSLTSDEIAKVKKAVKDANPDLKLSDDDITVAEDGTVTVKKGNQTGTIAKENTVTQKLVENKFNPPKKPVEVENAKALSEDEIKQVKQAVKDANPDRNFKDEDIKVGADGTVKINQNGKVGTIPANKTVVQKDTILKIEAPDKKVEVKNPANLTQKEKDEVAAAVKAKNNLADDDKIEVDSMGNVTVTTADGKKTGTLKAEDTVKPFDRAGKDLNYPEKTTVANPIKLTEQEKQEVRDAVKAVNKDLDFKDEEIKVADDGTVTVPMGTAGEKTITADKTVKKAETADNMINLVAPEKTPVQNIDELTAEEKEAVKKAVKKANPTLPDTANIEVAEDGSVVVTDGDKTGTLSQKDTVVDDTNKFTLNKPRPVKVVDPQNVTTEEQGKIKEAVKAVNPGLTDDQITVDDKGNVTVTVKEGEKTKTAKLGPEDTIEKDETPETGIQAPDTPITVDNAKALTPENKKAVEDAVRAKNPGLPEGAKVEVADDGTVTVKDKDDKVLGTIPSNKTVKQDETKLGVKAPEAVKVADPENVTPEEQAKIKEAVKKANTDLNLSDDDITVDNKGNVTVKKDGKEGKLTPAQTVKKADEAGAVVAPAEPVEVKDPSKLTPEEKEAVKKAVKDANPKLPADATIDVADDGTVTVKDKDGNVIGTIPANKAVKKAGTPTPSYDDIYYPDTDIYVGDNVNIYPLGNYGYDIDPFDLQAPRGVRVKANPNGSINVEVTPDYRGASEFYIDGYAYVNGNLVPIRIRIRAIDDAYARYRYESRRIRRDRRYDREEKEEEREEVDTREIHIHKAYIYGYTDGTVRPNGFITRAEAAAMLSRLLNEENTSSAAKPAFIDTPSKWYNNAINAVVARGIMRGYSDGTFKPNAPITRAEFAQMISAIDAKPFGTAPFNDVKGHWAELAIGKEYAAGRISGYPNGTFRPDAPITRAEAAHILNKIFERNYDLVSALQSEDKGNIKFFTDLSTSFWGYNDMVEATNTHTFRRRDKGLVQEDWDNINRISH